MNADITRGLSMPARSRIPGFALHRPTSIDEAVAMQSTLPDAAFHAGGIDLSLRLRHGTACANVIDLGGMPTLREVTIGDNSLSIGAALTHWQAASNPDLRHHAPQVAAYLEGLGTTRIRMQGTLGGNIMAQMPGYEVLPLVLALKGRLTGSLGAMNARDLVAALHADPGTSVQALLGLLIRIELPRRLPRISWTRQFRPELSLLLSQDADQSVTAIVVGDPRGPRVVPLGRALDPDTYGIDSSRFVTVSLSDPDTTLWARTCLGVLAQRLLGTLQTGGGCLDA